MELSEVRAKLYEDMEKGTSCPCCGQFVKLYKRPLTSSMAYGLILMYKLKLEWIHIEDYFKSLPHLPSSIRGDVAKLKYWGLLEARMGLRPDGSKRNGYYRVTPKGKEFVEGKTVVPSHVKLYNNKFLGFDNDYVSIKQSLGKKFNYGELMGYVQET